MRRITPKDFHSLEQNLFAAEAEAKAGHPEFFADVEAEPHGILGRACGSECLPQYCQVLRRHMPRNRIRSIFSEEVVFRAIKGHKAILACMKRKNEDGIKMAINKHREQCKLDIRCYAFPMSQERDSTRKSKDQAITRP